MVGPLLLFTQQGSAEKVGHFAAVQLPRENRGKQRATQTATRRVTFDFLEGETQPRTSTVIQGLRNLSKCLLYVVVSSCVVVARTSTVDLNMTSSSTACHLDQLNTRKEHTDKTHTIPKHATNSFQLKYMLERLDKSTGHSTWWGQRRRAAGEGGPLASATRSGNGAEALTRATMKRQSYRQRVVHPPSPFEMHLQLRWDREIVLRTIAQRRRGTEDARVYTSQEKCQHGPPKNHVLRVFLACRCAGERVSGVDDRARRHKRVLVGGQS